MNNDTRESYQDKKTNPFLYLGIGLLLLLLLIGGWALSRRVPDDSASNQIADNNQAVEGISTEEDTETFDDEDLEDDFNDEDSIAGQPDTADVNNNNIKVEGGTYYFKPNTIRVKKDQPVNISFTNVNGMHDFVLDEFNVKSKVIKAGETETVTFTPDKTGTFEFYCSVGNHRQMGMKGSLIVE